MEMDNRLINRGLPLEPVRHGRLYNIWSTRR
jgi:hypothetical protein